MRNRVSTSTSTAPGKPAAALHRDASDDTLIAKVAEGNRLAMQLLFVRHYARVYRFLVRMVDSPAVAEEIGTEVFLALWQQAGRFRNRTSICTWLLENARHKALRELQEVHEARPTGSEIERPAEPQQLPHGSKRRREILRSSLFQLSREHRAILDLVYYHHKSMRDLAQILGVPRHNVKTRVFYARKKLYQLVQSRSFIRAGS
jgi:RNA polymerase sigma-70 factor, ECF subfamily